MGRWPETRRIRTKPRQLQRLEVYTALCKACPRFLNLKVAGGTVVWLLPALELELLPVPDIVSRSSLVCAFFIRQ